jgi:hypothetical protein
MGEAFSIYSSFSLQRLRNWRGSRSGRGFFGSCFGVFFHAAGGGTFLGHGAGFSGGAFLGLLLVFALMGSGSTNESKQGEGQQGVFHKWEEAKVRKQNLAGHGWLGYAFLLIHAAPKVRTATQSAKYVGVLLLLSIPNAPSQT